MTRSSNLFRIGLAVLAVDAVATLVLGAWQLWTQTATHAPALIFLVGVGVVIGTSLLLGRRKVRCSSQSE